MSRVPNIFAEGRRGYVAAVSAAGVGEAVAIGFGAFAMRDVFAALHLGTPLPDVALVTLIASGVIVAGLRVASRTMAERLGQSFAMSIRRGLFKHLAGMSSSDVANRRAGALGMRFVGDLTAARGWASLGLTRIVSTCFVLPGAALTLWLLNPILAKAAAIPLVATLLVMLMLAIFVEPLHRNLRSKRANIAISMMERVTVAPELDLMRRTRREIKALDKNGTRLSDMAVARTRAVTGLRAVPEIGVACAGVAILWAASRSGAATAEAAAALAVLGILALPLRELAGVWDQRCAWKIASEKLKAVFAKPSSQRRPGKQTGASSINFNKVEFRDLSFDVSIKAGDTILVTGASGAGKSTFMALAAGLEKPDMGKVEYGKNPAPPRTALIGSRAPILQGSLRRALSLGALRRADDDVIEAAAHRLGFDPIIDRLGNLSARTGEGGRTLSEGETLLLQITRAYLTQPNLIIVDASQIAVDNTLKDALETLTRDIDATILIASIDPKSFDFATRCLRIEDRQITEIDVMNDPADQNYAA